MATIDTYWRSYVGGRWCDAADGRRRTLIDPATAEPLAEVALAGVDDVDAAVAAARTCVAPSGCAGSWTSDASWPRAATARRRC